MCCLQDGGLPSQSQGIAEDLVQDINRHAEVVLAGVDALARAAAADRVSWKGCCEAGKGGVGEGRGGCTNRHAEVLFAGVEWLR